jgi:TonB-dependent receptor
MRKSFIGIFFILSPLIFTTLAYSQGAIRGVVTDSTEGISLIGANVYIVGTSLGSATDLEGAFRIDRVPVGQYTLRVSYVGYATREFPVSVRVDEVTELDIQLVLDMLIGETVVVTGQAVGQTAAINQQLTSNTIVNVVSEEKIRELPDANAAESIGRLPGVSILRSGGEANKVILRGLDAKFTNITIDGVKIAPTDATNRGVDLSTISQSSLAGIELFKAMTPDKDGDALAGSINLVTKKAPATREFKADFKGDYNKLMKSTEQYDVSFNYGERFLNNFLGVQVAGNLERRIRSNERINVDYDQSILGATDYAINNFNVEFTDEIRRRNGFSVLFDLNTPDDGTIRISNVYGRTERDYLLSFRDYPSAATGNPGGNQGGNPVYNYRDREQEINSLTSSVRGDNNLLGLNLNWGLSYGESESDLPVDLEAIFVEPSGMMASAEQLKSIPERLIPLAVNDFSGANLYWTYYRNQRNSDKEKTAFLDLGREYVLSNSLSGALKIGGKYKTKERTNARTEDFTPYYLGRWQSYVQSADGEIVEKNFSGTYFEAWQNAGGLFIPIDQFFSDSDPDSRDIYGAYSLNPLIHRDRLRQWYELNRFGVNVNGTQFEVSERVGAGYIMNTLNFGQTATVIAGLRIEEEDNDYISTFMPKPVSGFPVPASSIQDTTSSASQSVVLPNLNIAVTPLEFMKIRLAAYKALARPDFNMRLDRYIAGRPAEVGTQFQVYVGNPDLKTAQAWNYEVNTSFFGSKIGLISMSAYYKEIDDMYHMLNNFNTVAVLDEQGAYQDTLMQRFDIEWRSQMGATPYNLTLPYNSPKPTKVWGFEFEHQLNFRFLPGLLKNFVLSYNASFVRSETAIYASRIDSVLYDPPGPIPPTYRKFTALTEREQKLEGMPEFFGNVALGYDIGRFSGRVSVFHKGEHNVQYSANGRTDEITNAFTRIDLALRQGITDNLFVFLNISNLTNVEDGTSLINRPLDRTLFDQSEKYGLTADFGITLKFD